MAKQEEAESNQSIQDKKLYCRELEKQIESLRRANVETIRLKNVEKFAAAGRMARTIAHEVRNPLTNISLALEQLNAEMPHNDETSLLIDMINRNTMRINQMITDLLNSTKFAQLSFSQTSIGEVMSQVLISVKHLAEQKGVSLIDNAHQRLPALMLDADKIASAFENIINYMMESVSPPGNKITIVTSVENEKCMVTFRDNGPGLSEEKVQRLFEPYFSAAVKGSGLALTHAQNIILNHGGDISVESEHGKGTCFIVVLPFA